MRWVLVEMETGEIVYEADERQKVLDVAFLIKRYSPDTNFFIIDVI